MAKTLIGDVQSRIAKRSRVISELEFKALLFKNDARRYAEIGAEISADSLFRQAAGYRADIRKLAKDQRLDKEISKALATSIMTALECAKLSGVRMTIPGWTLPKKPFNGVEYDLIWVGEAEDL